MRLIIFSHFDYENLIDDYIIYYLEKLNEISNDIVFVSTSQLITKETDKITKLCTKIISRENIGYDFMSYSIGLLSSGIDYKIYDQIILCNDSVYGPLFPLENMFLMMKNKKKDCWGIFQNFEINKHLQSFFLVFEKNIISSNFLDRFFSEIKIINTKNEIIKTYEVGLSIALEENGFILLPFIKKPSIIDKLLSFFDIIKIQIKLTKRILHNIFYYFNLIVISEKINYSLYFWEYSLNKKCPFIKIELFRKNPTGIFSYLQLLNSISKNSKYPSELIEKHIQRTKKFY